jgi:NADH:ubiquinone oxidoreductase subunit 6 (subunit J)
MLYHVSRSGQNYGPYTLEDLQRYVASGNVLPTDLAKSDEMPDWVPVSQVLGASMPAAPARIAAYGAPVPAYPGMASQYPDPPNLHWALVLLIGCFCGLFLIVWMFVQAAWMRKVNPRSKALTYYIVAMVVYVLMFVAFVAMAVSSNNGNGTPSGGLLALCGLLFLAYFVLFLIAIFTMRSDIEQHYNGPEPIGLSLSGVMTFFFNVFYFKYHFTRINELKRSARYGGAQV